MIEARPTDDGTYTLFDETSGECFHSHKGALTESEHVFINAGQIQQRLETARENHSTLRIIEMGLGTGLNYLLSARAAQAIGVKLEYHAVEINLLDCDTVASLQYHTLPGLVELSKEYQALMQPCQALPSGQHSLATSTGLLTLHLGDAMEIELPEDYFSLCYFDAFSPNTAPHLWRRSQLQKFYRALEPNGLWLSYCARGSVRRDLMDCGFSVEKLIGPPGKREMLRATKPHKALPRSKVLT